MKVNIQKINRDVNIFKKHFKIKQNITIKWEFLSSLVKEHRLAYCRPDLNIIGLPCDIDTDLCFEYLMHELTHLLIWLKGKLDDSHGECFGKHWVLVFKLFH